MLYSTLLLLRSTRSLLLLLFLLSRKCHSPKRNLFSICPYNGSLFRVRIRLDGRRRSEANQVGEFQAIEIELHNWRCRKS
ncbi:hypothetical protein CI102_11805 [Trichoderma harzianum]|nr:hypothetical protein CI102_11805 [Trichoderma harzianum]